MEFEIGQTVELMGVENAGLDITGRQGKVTKIPGHGLIIVALDGGVDCVSVWPENLKIVAAAKKPAEKEPADSEPAAKEPADSEAAAKPAA
mmetsp:Transcript_27930/g.50936  ORF Transcript_27930/g.50936 Transcript_27930/m.50936 type:complete len:91 (+) Transcript_27930:62-334(+)